MRTTGILQPDFCQSVSLRASRSVH